MLTQFASRPGGDALKNTSAEPRGAVAVAMSGGVDSTITAWLLREQGYAVSGFTMRLASTAFPGLRFADAAARAADAAARLGIPHQVLELGEIFAEQVLKPFVQAYAAGLTPSPCVLCNRMVKFGQLPALLRQAGCPVMATGHYARLETAADGTVALRRGLDTGKDQSYFLAQLQPEQLRQTLFPLGSMRKSEVRAMAANLALPVARERESQDLCFLPDGDFAALVLERCPELNRPGWIVDGSGRRLGRHDGAFRFTRGQRRGLGLGGGPWFVKQVSIPENLVQVGKMEELGQTEVCLSELNWLAPPPCADTPLPCHVQLRYRMKPLAAMLLTRPGGHGRLTLAQPVAGAAPGQLAVAYHDDRVLASGWITADTGENP